MNKPKAEPKVDKDAPIDAVQIDANEGDSDELLNAKAATTPAFNAALTMAEFHPLRDRTNVSSLVKELGGQTKKIESGSMVRAEAMLTSQAHALDTIFNTLAQRSARNINAGHMGAGETYLRMALKAQSQCRTTLEALVEIKYPKSPTFIKQANIAEQQQVNNGVSGGVRGKSSPSHEKTINPSNELLTKGGNETLDTGRSSSAVGANSQLATMGKIHRRKDSGRQSKVSGQLP